jgi:C4-type Zn-finger protein
MNTPTLTIQLNVDCPHCEEYIDLLAHDMGMNDEGEIISQTCPKDGHWTDSHKEFDEEVKCPECGKTFRCEGIDW